MSVASRTANLDDVRSWLELVSEVEELFGPMPSFETHLRRAIARGTAIVVPVHDAVAGGALLSSDDRTRRILWLAVRRSQRGRGVGAALVTAALERWPADEIEVVTFPAEVSAGAPARRLYERFGFVCVSTAEPAQRRQTASRVTCSC